MVTVYTAANTLDEVQNFALVTDSTNWRDSAWAASGMAFASSNNSTTFVEVGYYGGLTADTWIHLWYSPQNSWANQTFVRIYNAAGVNIFNILYNNGHLCQYWNGTAFVNVGTPNLPTGNIHRYDLHTKIAGVNSLIELYRDGILLGSTVFDGSNAAVAAGIDHWRVAPVDTFAGGNGGCMELITSDTPTINFRYATSLPATLGSHQDFIGSGTIANVAKVAINDSTSIQSGTVGNKTTYKPAVQASVQAAQAVLFTKVIVRGRIDSTGPKNIDGMFTIGGTDYFSADNPMTFGFAGYSIRFATDPSTGIAWTPSAAGSAIEFGVRSAT